MSRIGKKPIPIESGTKVTVTDRQVVVEAGGKRLALTHRPEVSVRVEEGQVLVERIDNSRTAKAMHGLTRALVANMIEGVTKGFQKELEIVGVGIDKQLVGQVAAEIRAQQPPEPYNGKGIKYSDEQIIRKQGKAFVGGGA